MEKVSLLMAAGTHKGPCGMLERAAPFNYFVPVPLS